jgi:hypothetical protein
VEGAAVVLLPQRSVLLKRLELFRVPRIIFVMNRVLVRRLQACARAPGAAQYAALGARIPQEQTHTLQPDALARHLHGTTQHLIGVRVAGELVGGREHRTQGLPARASVWWRQAAASADGSIGRVTGQCHD